MGRDVDIFKLTELHDKQYATLTACKKEIQILEMKLDEKRKIIKYLREKNETLFMLLIYSLLHF